MRRFFVKTLIFILVIISIYIAWFSVIVVEDGMMGMVKDLQSNKNIRLFHNKYNFIWQGSIPWLFSIKKIPLKRNAIFDIKIPIPPFENLKDDYYSGKITINIIYRILPDKFFDITKLENKGEFLNSIINKYIHGFLIREIYGYLVPYYRGNEILNNNEIIIKNVQNNLKEKFQLIGLNIVNFDVVGKMAFPDRKTYNEGLLHLVELRKITKMNEKELKILRNKLKRDKILNEQLYSRLFEISKIIKENPDMLKYFYIDKMADNVKVIISSDSSGFPLDMGNSVNNSQSTTKSEIDNLR